MNNKENIVSAECIVMEQSLSRMLARVERRCAQTSSYQGDSDVNMHMQAGLRAAVNLTHAFMQAASAGYSPAYRARKLVALADGMLPFIDMYRGLEGEKNLSPLFERVLNREYSELRQIIGQMHDAVCADGDLLLHDMPEKPRSADPVTFITTCMLVPFAIVYGVMAGVAQGMRELQNDRATPLKLPQSTPRLRLVHSQ